MSVVDRHEEPGRVADSLWEYAGQVFVHWPWLLVGTVAVGLGFYSVAVGHILAARSWMWFAVGFGAASVAQFLAFMQVRRERNEALTIPVPDRVSVYAVAASRGSVPPPIAAPLDYQVHALRQAVSYLRAHQLLDVDVRTLDSVLKRAAWDGVDLVYEPLEVLDCEAGLQRLVETGELIEPPEHRGYSYRLAPSA